MTDPNQEFDVIIVGAGPAGATAAYFLARGMGGFPGKHVALLEKETFPRDKFCGDAWCAPALDLMEEMGVLQQLEAEGLVQDCTSGGFVSPSGESFIASGEDGGAPGTRCYAIKRILCDERIARRAAEVGAELSEGAAFAEARLESDGLWSLRCEDGRVFRSRVLIAADGAASRVARSLGVVHTPPEGVASRQYVKGGTHNFKSGGVLFYPKYILPGYIALFRHYNDDIDLGGYLIPGGAAKPEDLARLYEDRVMNDPFIQRILGPRAEFLERLRVASLRTGGVERSTARQFLAVGDAAGQTDPLTGEGIHTGMIGAKLAAQTLHEMFARSDFSEEAIAVYHDRWMKDFGKDFPASAAGGRITYKLPFLLDAANVVAQRKGDGFMADFGAAMTGVKPKTTFLRPGIALPLGAEVARQFFIQKVQRPYASEEEAYAARAVERSLRSSAFINSCLIDPEVDVRGMGSTSAAGEAADAVFRFAGEDSAARRILVLYGTEYGFAKEVAGRVSEHLAKVEINGDPAQLSLRCISLANYALIPWEEAHTCLFICSTSGDGIPPLEAKPFFEALRHRELSLEATRIAVLALGDHAYPNFCRAGHTLRSNLNECGASELLPITEVDKEDEAVVRDWTEQLRALLAKPETWEGVREEDPADQLRERVRTGFSQDANKSDAPSRDNPVRVRIVSKRPLTQLVEPGDVETIHVELSAADCAASLLWAPGDALGVFPINCHNEVRAVLAALERSGDETLSVAGLNNEHSLIDALTHHLDIKTLSTSTLTFVTERAREADEQTHAREIQADAAGYCEVHELQDLLRDFPVAAAALDPQALVDQLERMVPRYYSIASAPTPVDKPIALTVAVVRYELGGRPRTGLATTFLADRVHRGEEISVFVQRNPAFRLPAEGSAAVMIGAGTGVAPYRAFLDALAQRAEGDPARMRAQAGDREHLLFFGCRHADRDFLYREEWEAWRRKQVLALHTAFSRDQAEKIYVQDRMREQGALLWERMERGDSFYICGDATRMAVDVEWELLTIVREHGGKNAVEAERYLDALRNQGRLEKDVWAT